MSANDPLNRSSVEYGATDAGKGDDDDGYSSASNEEAQKEPAAPPINLNTRFAADRTYMAADRTAIAWVRTAISMIGFGVTLAKTADLLQSEGILENKRSLQAFGVAFVVIAWLGLILVVVQNVHLERRLAASGYVREDVGGIPLGLSMAVLVLLVGILGAAVIFHPVGS